jgi:hypothetical protein
VYSISFRYQRSGWTFLLHPRDAMEPQQRLVQKKVPGAKSGGLSRKPAKHLRVALLGRGQCFEHFVYGGGVFDVVATIYLQLILHGLGGGRREHPAQG